MQQENIYHTDVAKTIFEYVCIFCVRTCHLFKRYEINTCYYVTTSIHILVSNEMKMSVF